MLLFGCKKSFFDINDNPNSPTEEDVLPKHLLPMVLNNTAKKMAIDYDYVAHWMGYWARGYSYGASIPLENYVLTNNYETGSWVNGNTSVPNPTISWYDILKDAKVMEDKGKNLNQPFYVGAAKVVKTIGYMYLVDIYNNVPYTEALDIKKHIAPKYDKGDYIYKDLLLQLDSAALAFSENFDITAELEAADVMFHGDVIMWKKLINTQRLKLLIHQADYLGGVPTNELKKINDDGNGFIMSGETAEVQPGYSVNKYKLNPFYAKFLMDENNNLVDDFNRANNYVLNKYRDNNDERYLRVFSKATDPVFGEYAGNNLGNPVVRDAYSSNLSNVAGPGLAKSSIQPQWLFTSVESLFLQAEAAQRGWLTDDAETVYKEAVTESFLWLEVADAINKADTYLNNEAIADWAAAGNKLALIINQKHLALCGINNIEAWTDYRRTGFPNDVPLSLNSGRGSRKIPLRLLYPQNEYSFNSANVNAQGVIDPQTSKIFWDVN